MSDLNRIKQNLQLILDRSPEFTETVGYLIETFAGHVQNGLTTNSELKNSTKLLPDTFLESQESLGVMADVCPSCGDLGCDSKAMAFAARA